MTDPDSDEPASTWNPRRHSEKRSLILCAIGAVAGLAVAGAGLFTAQGTRIAGVPPEDIAIVNQVPILMSDYESQIQATYSVGIDKATPEQKRTILDQMIREELYVQRGIELGLQTDIIEVRQALVGAVEAQQAVDASATQPSEEELRSFYQARTAKYSNEGLIKLVDLIAPSADVARAAVVALRGGQSIPTAMAAFKLRSSGKVDDGQEFYFAARIHLTPKLFAVAEKLKSGQVSDPVTMPDGIHILVVETNQPPIAQSLEAVRDQVLADYRTDKTKRMQEGADRFLRRRADVQIAKGLD